MMIEHNDHTHDVESRQSKRQQRVWLWITVTIGVFLAIVNVITWLVLQESATKLEATQSLAHQVEKINILDQQRNDLDGQLQLLMGSFQHPGMPETLQQNFASVAPDQLMVCRTTTTRPNATAYYLYSPDSSQTLSIDVGIWGTSMRLRPSAIKTTADLDARTLEIALEAGKLSLFQFALLQLGRDGQTFRVTLDDRELFRRDFPGFSGYSASTYNAEQDLGVRPANLLQNRFFDLEKTLENGHWLTLSERSYRLNDRHPYSNKPKTKDSTKPKERTVTIVASLKSSGPFFVAESGGQVDRLKFKWRPKVGLYEIVEASASNSKH